MFTAADSLQHTLSSIGSLLTALCIYKKKGKNQKFQWWVMLPRSRGYEPRWRTSSHWYRKGTVLLLVPGSMIACWTILVSEFFTIHKFHNVLSPYTIYLGISFTIASLNKNHKSTLQTQG